MGNRQEYTFLEQILEYYWQRHSRYVIDVSDHWTQELEILSILMKISKK
jgi:hypothetical protein